MSFKLDGQFFHPARKLTKYTIFWLIKPAFHLIIKGKSNFFLFHIKGCQRGDRARRRTLLAHRTARGRRHLLRVMQEHARLEVRAGVRVEPEI